ncbi:hypothetical protein ACWEJP_04365 [Streptomyces sp. NPDC004749]
MRQPAVPLAEIRREAAVLLPGCNIRRLLFWRYLLVFRNHGWRDHVVFPLCSAPHQLQGPDHRGSTEREGG